MEQHKAKSAQHKISHPAESNAHRANKKKRKNRKPRPKQKALFVEQHPMDQKYLQNVRKVLPQFAASDLGTGPMLTDAHTTGTFLAAMEHPFDHPPARCPLSYNDVITLRTHAAQTTVTLFDVVVAHGTTATFQLLPGWTTTNTGVREVRDTFMFGSPVTDTAGTSWIAGPCAVADLLGANPHNPACVFRNSLAGSNYNLTVGAGSGAAAFGWDVPLPYVGTDGMGELVRWRVTAIGMRVYNRTPAVNRGGSMVTVQPTFGLLNYGTNGPVGSFAIEPSFHEWREYVDVSYIVKPKDLTFNSSAYPNNVGSLTGSAALLLFLVNSTDFQQNYAIEIVYHWEVGGDTVFQISHPTTHSVAAKSSFEPGVTSAQSKSPSAGPVGAAKGILAHVTDAAKAAGAMLPAVIKAASSSSLPPRLMSSAGFVPI